MQRFKKIITVIPLVVLSLTPLLWFKDKGNVLINGIDTNFPLDPWIWFARRLYVWTDFPNAGIDFSSSTAGLFFHLIQVIPYKLGFSLQQVQILSLMFWFSLIIFSTYVLSRVIFPKSFLIRILFVVLYSFNIYLFNTWENVKVANLSLIAAIPLAVSVLILLVQSKLSRIKVILLSSFIGVILSGAGINPSYFICFLLILLIISIVQIVFNFKFGEIKRYVFNLFSIVVPIFLVNLFWLLPTINYVFRNVAPGGSIDKIGFTNWVNSLSENTSLLNIFRLQGAWDWYAFDQISGLPLYIPYALNYFYKLPFIIFSFLLPALVILALFLLAIIGRKGISSHSDERLILSLHTSFAVMLIIGVFLGAGTHLPTGDLFRWLSVHLPFFTIFRSPWYIFTPLVTLSLAALVCLFFYNLETVGNGRLRFIRYLVPLLVLVLIVGNLFYTYPLITGKIFRPERDDSFFVQFPPYVFEVQKWLISNDGVVGRIAGYPDDEIEKFTWGYRGIESILGLLSNNQVIFSPLNAPDSSAAVLIKEFYKSLKKNEISKAASIAQKLNIGLIFEKDDQKSLSPSLPGEVKEKKVVSFDKWSFYKFPEETNGKIYSPTSIFLGPTQKDGVSIAGAIQKDGVLLDEKDSVVKSIDSLTDYRGVVVLAKNSQKDELESLVYSVSKLEKRLVSRDLSNVSFSINVPEDGDYNPIIERYGLENFGIEVGEQLEAELDGSKVILEPENYSDSYLQFTKINLSRGEHRINIKLKNDNLISGGDFSSGITFGKGGYGEGRGEYIINEEGGNKFLQIFNVGKANVSADFSVSSFDPYASYYVEFKYKQIYGNNGTVVVLQGNDKTLVKAQTERLPNYPEWNKFSFYYEPVLTNSIMKVDLESPYTNDPLGTKVFYDDLIVYRVLTNNLFLLKEGNSKLAASPVIGFVEKSPVSYEGKVSQVKGPHLIVFSENYSPEWELTIFDKNGKELKNKYSHFSSNLYANAWYIDEPLEYYSFKIFYKPQKLFLAGLTISSATILLLVFTYFYGRFYEKRKNK